MQLFVNDHHTNKFKWIDINKGSVTTFCTWIVCKMCFTLTLSSNETTNGSSVSITRFLTSVLDNGGPSSSTESTTGNKVNICPGILCMNCINRLVCLYVIDNVGLCHLIKHYKGNKVSIYSGIIIWIFELVRLVCVNDISYLSVLWWGASLCQMDADRRQIPLLCTSEMATKMILNNNNNCVDKIYKILIHVHQNQRLTLSACICTLSESQELGGQNRLLESLVYSCLTKVAIT